VYRGPQQAIPGRDRDLSVPRHLPPITPAQTDAHRKITSDDRRKAIIRSADLVDRSAIAGSLYVSQSMIVDVSGVG
jgi:hypothetical protein